MSNGQLKNLIAEVSAIGRDAQALVAELQPKAQQGANLTQAELRKIKALVKRSEEAMSAAEQRAKERRAAQIRELEALVRSIESSLAVPGLSQRAVDDLKQLKRNKLAQLVRLRTRAGLDFGGILSAAEVQEIAAVLKEARAAVARKKRAAGFLGSLLKIANLSLGIVAKAGGMM